MRVELKSDSVKVFPLPKGAPNATPRFDPKTEQFTVHKSASRNASVRQILGRPGEVWLPESGRISWW